MAKKNLNSKSPILQK